MDPLIELAQLGWLNAKLHDDIVARREHLPPAAERARQLAAMVDAYGLTAAQRRGFVDQMIQFAICDTAGEADDAAITPETTAHPIPPPVLRYWPLGRLRTADNPARSGYLRSF